MVHLVPLINKSDFKILRVFTSSLKNRQNLSLTTLSQYSNLSQNLVEHHLERLIKFGLIGRSNIGYTLLVTGLDLYVLKILANRNIITAIGPQIGIGKEAEVYLCHDSLEQQKILKIFRLGRSSFKQIKRKRNVNLDASSWLLLNIETAKKEFDILKHLTHFSTAFPNPLYSMFHVIVMEPIYGSRLSETEDLNNPELVLENIIDTIKIAYHAGYVNGDLNEYNILVTENNIVILDWPQAVKVESVNSNILLMRDVKNILQFFSRKYDIDRNMQNIFNSIKCVV